MRLRVFHSVFRDQHYIWFKAVSNQLINIYQLSYPLLFFLFSLSLHIYIIENLENLKAKSYKSNLLTVQIKQNICVSSQIKSKGKVNKLHLL